MQATKFLAGNVFRLRWMWLTAGLIVLLTGILYGTKVFDSLKSGGTSDPTASSTRETEEIAELFPRSRISIVLLASSPTLTVENPAYKAELLRLIDLVKQDPARPSAQSFYDSHQGSFVSKNRHETFVLIGVSGDEDAAYLHLKDRLKSQLLHITLGGPAVADYEINIQVQKDLPKFGAISLPILAILLIVIFRSLIAALLPLLIGAISVLGAFSLTRLLSYHIDISVFAANIISLLGLGLAIDYSLLFVSRFRDEIKGGCDVENSVAIALQTAGSSILLSGLTVALSLLGLLGFPQMFLRSMGIGGALAVVVAMVSSLTVLPAILSIIGQNIDLLSIPLPGYKNPIRENNLNWRKLGQFVVRQPLLVISVTLGILFAAGTPFLHVRFANPGIETLPSSFQSRIVGDALTQDFFAGHSAPIEILVTMEGSPTSPENLPYLLNYVDQLKLLPGVVSVNSLANAGPNMPSQMLSAALTQSDPPLKQLKDNFLSGDSALITVDYVGSSYAPNAQALVRDIREFPVSNSVRVDVGGDTAELVDQLDSLNAYLPVSLSLVFLATFLVLLTMLSSIFIPVKVVVLNALSLSASFGLMTWIFQDGHLHNLLHFNTIGSLDPTLPVLIFAIAFGLATDYEVFLVSRIKEEYERTGSNSDAIVIGVEKTGGIITSAGLLLVVVVAAFGMGSIISMKEMGVGLAIAVIIDASVVRTLLVPAAMQLLGRWNWWLP